MLARKHLHVLMTPSTCATKNTQNRKLSIGCYRHMSVNQGLGIDFTREKVADYGFVARRIPSAAFASGGV
jgi:hypothetical protein